MEPGNLKINCEHCEGHIEFPAEMADQVIDCPHCRQHVSLRVKSEPGPPSLKGESGIAQPPHNRVERKETISHCPKCGKQLIVGATRCLAWGCDYALPYGVTVVAPPVKEPEAETAEDSVGPGASGKPAAKSKPINLHPPKGDTSGIYAAFLVCGILLVIGMLIYGGYKLWTVMSRTMVAVIIGGICLMFLFTNAGRKLLGGLLMLAAVVTVIGGLTRMAGSNSGAFGRGELVGTIIGAIVFWGIGKALLFDEPSKGSGASNEDDDKLW